MVNLALLFFAAHAVANVGPSQRQLAEALSAHLRLPRSPIIRDVQCRGFDEEPTEFVCTWRQQEKGGNWRHWSAHVAIDGGRLVVTDNPIKL